MSCLIGVDGGGTRTTVVVADANGREQARRTGPPGLVDPRAPVATAGVLVSVVRQAMQQVGARPPAAALCAGLAGVGSAVEREAVRRALAESGVAQRVLVVCDSEIALEGAFRGGAGILLIAGTGSIAYGRGEDGRTERCGGWGMVVGDEGSGFAIGRDALGAALRGVDGRGAPTGLLPRLLNRLGLPDAFAIPPWAGRATKAEIAALVPVVLELAAADDAAALQILRNAAREQALHAAALVQRLAPWTADPPIVPFGGVFGAPLFREFVEGALSQLLPAGFRLQEPLDDAVGGAVRLAVAAMPAP